MKVKIIKNARIVDVLEQKAIENGCILIEDGIIKEVGTSVAAPADAEVLDLQGATVLPGLFNCHVHMTMDPAPDPFAGLNATDAKVTIDAIKHLGQHLSSGVTYIRDVGAPHFIDIDIRDSVNKGRLVGPDMQVSGKCICMTGGHGWTMGREADGVDECRKAAREQLKAGADWLKIMATGGVMTKGVEPGSTQLNQEEMAVIVEEAAKVGVRTCTHAQGNTGIKNAIRAGLHSIEHGCYLDEESINMMLERGTWLVPTLAAPHFIVKYGVEHGVPDYAVRKAKMVIESHYDSFARAYKAGVRCAAGTDSGTPFNRHDSIADELILMSSCGLSPMESIVVGTINSAKLMEVDNILGSITPGKKAHLAVFEGNPLEDMETLRNCLMTLKNGEVVYSKN